MSVRPLHDRLFAKRTEQPEIAPGGIVIPDTAREKPQYGQVIAVGSGRLLNTGAVVPLAVRTGDRIVFGKFAGTEVIVDGEELLVLREDEIFAVLESAVDAVKAA